MTEPRRGTRRPVAFFDLSGDKLSPENIDTTVDWIVRAIEERSQKGRQADEADPYKAISE